MRNPFRRRADDNFRFETKNFIVAKDKGGIISPEGKCVWMAVDYRGPWIYFSNSFFGLIKILITEWRHDKNIAG